VTDCNGLGKACTSSTSAFDCAQNRCLPACQVAPAATECDACVAAKCCGSVTACRGDTTCQAQMGAGWTALGSCAQTFCAQACAAVGPSPPAPLPAPDPSACNAAGNWELACPAWTDCAGVMQPAATIALPITPELARSGGVIIEGVLFDAPSCALVIPVTGTMNPAEIRTACNVPLDVRAPLREGQALVASEWRANRDAAGAWTCACKKEYTCTIRRR
jgi:hypothetical protein